MNTDSITLKNFNGIKKRILIITFFLFGWMIVYSQMYNSLYIESDSINNNNVIYIPGKTFVYKYNIVHNGECKKLIKNEQIELYQIDFKLEPVLCNENTNKLYVFVDTCKYNQCSENSQTKIYYIDSCGINTYTGTGVIENDQNLWIHPVRYGFFRCLELCPYPYIKFPIQIGSELVDSNRIGQRWGNEFWGTWKGSQLLTYHYKVVGKQVIETNFGSIECYRIDSYSNTNLGISKLTAYFSEVYGFVQLDYEINPNLKIYFSLLEILENKKLQDFNPIF